jgi:hypothetical protein
MTQRVASIDHLPSASSPGSLTIQHETAGYSAAERSVASGKAARRAPLESHSEFSRSTSRDPIGLLLGQAQSRVPELVAGP